MIASPRMVFHDSLDRIDREIVRHLQEDGRRSFREIARDINVSEATVRARFRNLQESGILRIVAFADPFRLGHSVLALVFVQVEADTHERVVEAIASWPEVSYVSTLIGSADMFVQVVCRDNEALWELVSRIRGLGGVRRTETMIEMKVHKFKFLYTDTGLGERPHVTA